MHTGLGFHVDWHGMWAEIAEGVSGENLAYGGTPVTNKTALLDLFMNKINHTQVGGPASTAVPHGRNCCCWTLFILLPLIQKYHTPVDSSH
jgi:hypothetical protein